MDAEAFEGRAPMNAGVRVQGRVVWSADPTDRTRTGAGNGGVGPGTANPAAGPSAQARVQLPHPPKPPTQAGPGR